MGRGRGVTNLLGCVVLLVSSLFGGGLLICAPAGAGLHEEALLVFAVVGCCLPALSKSVMDGLPARDGVSLFGLARLSRGPSFSTALAC